MCKPVEYTAVKAAKYASEQCSNSGQFIKLLLVNTGYMSRDILCALCTKVLKFEKF